MKITIQGQDYSGSLDSSHPLNIERKLNEPSTCRLYLTLPTDGSLTSPMRNQSLAVTGDDGTPYFTGYIAVNPAPVYAGVGIEGPRYRTAVNAISDEILADQLQLSATKGAAGMAAGALMSSLLTHTGCAALSTTGLSLNVPVSNVTMASGASWSKWAEQVANEARAGYRALQGSVQLAQIPVTLHPLNEADGSLDLNSLALTSSVDRSLANDVTVCGEEEPAAYVTEYFPGDGTTTQFQLSTQPFSTSNSKTKIIREQFNESSLDLTVWKNSGGPGYLSLGSGGLTMNGGNGVDGATQFTWIDPIEMAGTLLLEAVGVQLSLNSTGVLAGFFSGLDTLAGCVAGFQASAKQGSGQVTLQPIVEGTCAGTSYPVNPANQYALRIRLHSAEVERTLSVYRSYGDSGAIANGGQAVDSCAQLCLEIQEYVNGVAGEPVVLYDGSIASVSQACLIVAASSINLVGTMRAINLTNLGSGWVVSTPVEGNPRTRRLGTLAEGGECHLDRAGKLSFYTGFAPQAGEQAAVSYRTVGRAVGRAVNSSSQQALTQAGLPDVVMWIGKVTNPQARSSADCRNAAATIVTASAGVSALWKGTYKGTNSSFTLDVWPGDALALDAPSMNLNTQLIVRAVNIVYNGSSPDLVTYDIAFANDWAEDLAIKTSSSIPPDAWLPAPIYPAVMPNLTHLTVTSVNGATVTINAGVTAPTGGGFEIRRRDFVFMPGEDSDLVMRGTQENLTFCRTSASDRFYIRMYDGSTPPNYSEFSTALFINLPLGS